MQCRGLMASDRSSVLLANFSGWGSFVAIVEIIVLDWMIVTRPYDAKLERRRAVAQLPVEEKLKILIKLQHLQSQSARNQGRPYKRPWDVKPGSAAG